jgi:hypothetical protein
MNVEIGAEATLFPEKEYISGIFVAVGDGRSFFSEIGRHLENINFHFCSTPAENRPRLTK